MDTENTNFILDPEAEKYVFDPANPTQFKAYDLLLKITKERNNVVFFSPEYLLEIFHAELFDNEWDKKLWDKPDNYAQLSYAEKINVFIQNYSNYEFGIELANKSDKFLKHSFWYLFAKKYISYTKGNLIFLDEDLKSHIESIYSGLPKSFMRPKFEESEIFNTHFVFFLSADYYNIIYCDNLRPHVSSVFITTIPDYKRIWKKFNYKNTNFKPIILKDIQHIHALLNYLNHDIRSQKALENYVETPISYLQSATLQNYFSIENIALNELGEKKEIYFMGENGSGKTLLLQALFLALKGNPNEGIIFDYLKSNDNTNLILQATDNQGETYEFLSEEKTPKNSFANLFAYGVNRRKRENDENKENYFTLFNEKEGFLESPVLWLQHLDYKQLKGGDTGISLEMAKIFLEEILDKKVNIEVTADEVFFYEKGAKLTLEQLSDGYKSVLVWVCDLLKRFCDKQPQALSLKDFRGIVLIDEVDLFLSPTWQYKIVRQLRKWFQNVQFIITTHSPTVILGASEDAVFFKTYKENGKSKVSEPFYNKDFSNLMMNGIITSPLFDLESARPFAYKPNENELETADFHSIRIHKQLKARLNEQKKAGKIHFSVAEIDDLIANIIQESQAPYEKDDKN